MSVVLPFTVVSAGTFSIPATTVPQGMSVGTVTLDRSRLTSSTLRISWLLDVSSDNGATWRSIGGAGIDFGAQAPTFIEKETGLPVSGTRVRFDTLGAGFESSSAQRKVRGTVTLNESAEISVSLDWK